MLVMSDLSVLLVDAIPLACGCETLCVGFIPDIGIRMVVVYRPPDCLVLDTVQFADHLSELCIVEKASVVVGDFNFDFDSRVSIFPVKNTGPMGSPLGNFLLENGFFVLLTFPAEVIDLLMPY